MDDTTASCLQWVIVDGKARHVSEFKHLLPDERPEAFCPLCGCRLVLKLGNHRAHHAAHYEGSDCPATHPETAIHINTKYYLKTILSTREELSIWQPCNGWLSDDQNDHSCLKLNRIRKPYIRNWDRVEIEWQCSNYRLDVALLQKDKIVGAIEVFVTHLTEMEKIAYLNQQGIAWIEIKVDSSFYSGQTAWNGKTPLMPEKHNESLLQAWQCDACNSSAADDKRRAVETKRHQEEKQKKITYASQFEKLFIRVIDFYYPTGKRYRKIFVIQKRIRDDGIVLYADLQEVTSTWRQVAIEPPPITEQSYKNLKQALTKELDSKARPDWIIDKSRDWHSTSKGYDLRLYRRPDLHPFHYERVGNKWQTISKKSRSEQRPPWRAFGVEIPPKPSKMDKAFSSIFREYTCTKCGKVTTDWIQGFAATKTCICRECAYK